MKSNLVRFSLITVVAFTVGCGGGGSKQTRAADLLPERLSGTNLSRVSEPQVYVGDALWQYLGDETEIYQSYGFVEAATADYTGGEVELTIDVFRFDSPTNAKALYDEIRPAEGRPLPVGGDGTLSPGNIILVKGDFVVNIAADDESEMVIPALAKAGAAFGILIPDPGD